MKRPLLILFILSLVNVVSAQKIGLVLSGGGTKALSHIGVIKALEENNIPIDYVTGTSMGALVAGMYAIGMTPDEMIKMVTSSKFQLWSTGQIEDEFLFLYKKLDPAASMLSFKFNLSDSVANPKLPTNLIPTYQMDLALLEHFAGPTARAKGNFDSLFVPFRCVASDVYNAKQYVGRKGDVASAIRASMTFPFYFKAISIDSTLLFDGGIYNNFPWDVLVKDFNPDYIIGSNCSGNPEKPDEDNLIKQIESMIVNKTNYRIPENKGIVIENNFSNVSLLDFSSAMDIINQGYYTTIEHIKEIKEHVNRRSNPVELAEKRYKYNESLPPLIFNELSIEGLKPTQKTYVEDVFKTNKKKEITFDKFKSEYFKLLGDNTITSIYPTAAFDDSTRKFTIKLKAKSNSDLDLDIGGNISSSSMNQAYLGLVYKMFAKTYTRFFTNFYYGKLYSSFLVGGRQDFSFSKPFFYDIVLTLQSFDYFSSNPDPFFQANLPSFIKQYEKFGRVNYGFPLNSSSLIKLGYSFGINKDEYYQSDDFTKTDEPDKTDFTFNKINFVIEKNTLNTILYPYKGRKQYISATYTNGKEHTRLGTISENNTITNNRHDWMAFRVYNQSYHRISNKFWTGFLFDGIYTTKKKFSNYIATLLTSPVFAPFPQSQTIFLPNYRAESYLAFGVMPNYIFTPRIYLRAEAYLFMPDYQINKENDYLIKYGDLFSKRFFIGSLSFVYQTVLGPLSLSANYYNKEDRKFYFVANFGFVLFNRRSLEY